MPQGKCDRCRRYYRWNGRPLLRLALCPKCRGFLSRTTYFLTKYGRPAAEHPLEAIIDPDPTKPIVKNGAV